MEQSSEGRDDEQLKEGGSDQELETVLEHSPSNSSPIESPSPSPEVIKIGNHL